VFVGGKVSSGMIIASCLGIVEFLVFFGFSLMVVDARRLPVSEAFPKGIPLSGHQASSL
jgi:hypothetical protein